MFSQLTFVFFVTFCSFFPVIARREQIAEEDGRPIYKFSTDSPLLNTSGELEPLALYAGQVCGSVTEMRPAADVVRAIVQEAETILGKLRD